MLRNQHRTLQVTTRKIGESNQDADLRNYDKDRVDEEFSICEVFVRDSLIPNLVIGHIIIPNTPDAPGIHEIHEIWTEKAQIMSVKDLRRANHTHILAKYARKEPI